MYNNSIFSRDGLSTNTTHTLLVQDGSTSFMAFDYIAVRLDVLDPTTPASTTVATGTAASQTNASITSIPSSSTTTVPTASTFPVAAVIIPIVAVCIIAAVGIFFWLRRRNQRQQQSPTGPGVLEEEMRYTPYIVPPGPHPAQLSQPTFGMPTSTSGPSSSSVPSHSHHSGSTSHLAMYPAAVASVATASTALSPTTPASSSRKARGAPLTPASPAPFVHTDSGQLVPLPAQEEQALPDELPPSYTDVRFNNRPQAS